MKEFICKINICHFASRIVLFIYSIVISLFCVTCGNPSKKSCYSEENQMEVLIDEIEGVNDDLHEYIDIPIAINLSHTDDLDMRQLLDAEYKVTRETDNDIYIDINSKYYNEYISGHRFIVPKLTVFENSENVEYLTLDLDIVNNTDERLSINELNIKVEESVPDTLPVIYICTAEDHSNCVYFVNESWFNWKGFIFSYSILGKDESFNGEYKKSLYIPFFDTYTIVNLLPDLKDMGYDFDELENCIRNRNIRLNSENNTDYNVNPIFTDTHSSYLVFSINSSDSEFDFFKEKFMPFELKKDIFNEYVGVAKLYGSIRFDDSNFEVKFIADISLSTTGGFGALSYANDQFDVRLKSFGSNYNLQYPYTTVIEPYGAEMIQLIVNADKSSSHKFHIDVKNDNGLKIRSKNIHFHHYYPKN